MKPLKIYPTLADLIPEIKEYDTGLTGVRPSSGGKLHIGHYKGFLSSLDALKKILPQQLFVVVADHQAISDVPDKAGIKNVREGTISTTIDILSSIENPQNISIFKESDTLELLSYYKSLLEQYCSVDDIYNPENYTYHDINDQKNKNKLKGKENVLSLLFYQIGQATQVLGASYNGGRIIVPSGPDQFDPINLGNIVSKKINNKFGVNMGEVVSLSEEVEILGINGKKMGKSEGNTINLSDSTDDIISKIEMINDDNVIYSFIKNFGDQTDIDNLSKLVHLTQSEKRRYRHRIQTLILGIITPFQEKYDFYKSNEQQVIDILLKGSDTYNLRLRCNIDYLVKNLYS